MALDPGWAGIIGAAVGSAITIGGNSVLEWQKNRKGVSLAEKRKQRLRQMLNSERYTWRSLTVLAASIGADEKTTAELLIEIDARASLDNTGSWALVSRAPWPEDVQPKE